MPRRLFLSLVVAASILLAACGGASSSPPPTPTPTPLPVLTDPKEILAHAAGSLAGITSVHLKADLTGKIDPSGLMGSSGTGLGAKLDLTGSTVEGDIDVARSEAKLAVAAPNVLGLTADVIVDSGTVYFKSSLTGPKYQKLDPTKLPVDLPLSSASPGASPDPSAAAAMMDQLKGQLAKLPAPVKLPDEVINGVDSYHVQQKVSSTDVPQASDLPVGNVTVDIWTSKADGRPTRVVISLDAGTQGNLAISIDLTNYNASVDIAPPPADQISDQPFTIPGLTP